jgi:hypothetical protein
VAKAAVCYRLKQMLMHPTWEKLTPKKPIPKQWFLLAPVKIALQEPDYPIAKAF